jgi:hypothetical protein
MNICGIWKLGASFSPFSTCRYFHLPAPRFFPNRLTAAASTHAAASEFFRISLVF